MTIQTYTVLLVLNSISLGGNIVIILKSAIKNKIAYFNILSSLASGWMIALLILRIGTVTM